MVLLILFFFSLLFSERLVFVQTLQLFGYIFKILNKDELFLITIRDLKYNIRNHIYTNMNNMNDWLDLYLL